jgi:VCBS repeat-containing protein
MATTTVSGSTTVTVSNSGAAANLSTQTSEDALLANFDISTILAASGGGTKTTFYSIDNGVAGDDNPLVTTNKAFTTYDTDLLYKDSAVAGWCDGDTSALGAHVWIGTDGKIHYDATNIAGQFQQLAAGETTTDTIKYTIKMSNGTLSVGTLTVVITGTNDAAVITGSSKAELTETNAAQSIGGDLNATDVDSAATFVAQSNVAGDHGYGKFSIDENGTWTYTMNDAHDRYVGGQDYTDSITVKTADGTSQVITVTMHGTNDAAVITGTATDSVLEASGVLNGTAGDATASGDLNATDVDSSADFVVQNGEAKTYGTFSIDATGAWSYTLNNDNAAVQALNTSSTPLHELVTVATADGTEKVIDITINGANDAAVITGSSTAELTETNAAQSTGGDLNASDVDSAATFVAQSNVAGSNGYGKFSIDAAGTWTYTMNNAHDEFVGGVEYTDSITVKTADGTSQVIIVTMHGTSDALEADSDTSNDHDTDTATATTSDWDQTNGTDVKVGDGFGNTIYGGGGKDILYGAGGNDTLNGNVGVDTVYGQAGNDTVIGDNGEDTLYGGSGDDLLIGGGGGDELWGGSGNDTFKFTDLVDSSSNPLDTIHDFHHGFDRIDVSAIDADTANPGTTGIQAFTWGGTTATAHGVWYTQDVANNNTILHFDTNGSTSSDEMRIILAGVGLGLTDSDFLL